MTEEKRARLEKRRAELRAHLETRKAIDACVRGYFHATYTPAPNPR